MDFVLERPDGSMFGIEVKKSEAVDASDFKGLKVLAELAPENFRGGAALLGGSPFHTLAIAVMSCSPPGCVPVRKER